MDQTTLTQSPKEIMDFRAYEAAPGISVIVLPDAPTYTHVAASNDFIRTTGLKKADVIGKGHFAVFPKSPGDPNFTGELNLRASFAYIIQQKEPHEIPVQRYDIPNGDGTFCQKFWKINNAPILSDTGEVLYIVHTAADITDQVLAKQREEKIKELEKSHYLFMQAPVVIGIVKGDNYVIELANDDLLQVWGRAAEVIGKPLFEAIPELQGQGFKELLQQVQETGEPFFAFEHPIKLVRNGKEEVLYFDFVYKPFYEEGQKKAAGVFAVGHDITRQVEARQKFKNIIEQASDPILILKGEDMVLEVANEALFRLWKVDSKAIGKAFLEILPEMKDQGFLELLQQVYHTGEPFQGYEVPAVFEEANGETRTVYFNFTYQPYREADGSITGVLVLATDVTGQVLAQKQVEESQEELKQFKFMADQARDPFILMREDGTFAYLNKKALEAWGYTEEEAKSIRVPDVDPIYNDEVFSQAFARAQKEEIPTFETLHKRKDGHIYPVEVNMGGLTLNGKPHMFAVARDITERKKLEQALRENEVLLQKKVEERTAEIEAKNKELERSNKNLEDFAYAASHDLKEPIRKINFFADRLKLRLADKLEEEDRRYFERLEVGIKRMNTLIDDLLLYSHVNRGVSSIETVDLNQMLSFVLDDLELQIEEKGAKIKIGILPTIQGRPRQLQQLFENLIGNALKYSKEGIAPVVQVTSRLIKGSDTGVHSIAIKEDQMYHLLELHDNGIGFAQKDAERIFNVFTRLHGNAEYKGTGVGLSIVQKVVENHSGYIWAESTPGEGATFRMLLPVE